jgi:uncharacterized protein (TIGR02594 family)
MNRKAVFDTIRAARSGKGFIQSEVASVDALLDGLGVPKVDPSPRAAEPRWMIEARKLIGTTEIPGPKHNRWIADGWKRLGAGWFTDDETPWCGLFVAHCIEAAGLPFPKMFPRAMAWAEWGKACPATVGAVVVFKRQGGGHVGFLVGESPTNYYVLGGNQSNAVNIMPLAKNRAVAIRWPTSLGTPAAGLPKMSGGVVSTNEA